MTVAQAEDSSDHSRPAKRGWLSWSRLAILAIVTLILLMRPWGIHLHTTEEAVAEEPRIAVMYFDNLADPTDSLRLGDIATDLLITGLSQSRQVRVLSTQRLYDLLKLMGREGQKRIDRSIATEVARNGKAKWMLLGSILEISPHLIMTTQLIEVATGQVASAARIHGKDGEDIFALSDSLTAKISSDLSWPVREEFASIDAAKNKTNSLDAYRYYLEAVEAFYRYDNTAMFKALRKAIEIDSTFAMAYYLAVSCQWISYANADTVNMAKAIRYSDKATQVEQLYIKSMQLLIAGNYPRGIDSLKSLVARYPEEKDAYGLLGVCYYRIRRLQESTDSFLRTLELDSLFADGYAALIYNYMNMGDYERTVWASNKYISLKPDEAAPYLMRGDVEAMHGDNEQAMKWYRQAVDKGSGAFVTNLGLACVLAQQYACADSCFQFMAANNESKDRRSSGRYLLALIPLYQGKFSEAKRILDEGTAADKMEKAFLRAYRTKFVCRAFIYEQFGQFDSALHQIEQIKINYPKNYNYRDKFFTSPYYARLLALNKRFDEAEMVAESLKIQIGENEAVISDYWWTVGNIDMVKGNWERAITDFGAALQHSDSEFTFRVSLSYARLQAGRPAEAIVELEKGLMNKHWWRLIVPIEAVKAHYYLGMAYEQTGQNEKAMAKYEEFLDIWKNADPGIVEVVDARNRLARLKISS